MGEAADYEMMYQEMQNEQNLAAQKAKEQQDQQALERAAEYQNKEGVWWQKGCPFKLKDVVWHSELGEGKVIGLPLAVAAPGDPEYDRVWVHFADCTRAWVTWDDLKELRRSPNARLKRSASDNPPGPRKSIQVKLFDTSRGSWTTDDVELAMPKMASIERDRKIRQKPPVGQRGHNSSARSTTESKVSVPARLSQFPNQGLRNSCGKLFCGPCVTELVNIKSSIETHLKSCRHKTNLDKYNVRSSGDIQIMTELGEYFEANPGEAGATVLPQVNLYRFRVTQTFMAAGVPPHKINLMRTLLERAGMPLCDSGNLMSMVPKVEADEFSRVLEELADQLFSCIFDGTTRIGEALNVILRWCTADFHLVQRLVAFVTVLRHMNAAQMANVIVQILLSKLKTPIQNVVAFVRDSASVNGAAVRRLAVTFTNSANVLCICHTLSNMGLRFEFDMLAEFISLWVQLLYSHNAAKTIWAALIGEAVVGYSNVRWYCKHEIAMQIARNFSWLGPFFAKLDELNVGEALRIKLKGIYYFNMSLLKLQFAAMLDMVEVVSTTYSLEGDGLPLMLAYGKCEALLAKGRSLETEGSLPNVEAVLRGQAELKKGVEIKKVWAGHGNCIAKIISIDKANSTLYPGKVRTVYKVQYALDGAKEDLEEEEIRPLIITEGVPARKEIVDGLKPAFEYFQNRLTGNCDAAFSCVETYNILKLAQVFDPVFAATNLNPAMVDDLMSITPLGTFVPQGPRSFLEGLKAELPAYLTAAAGCAGLDRADVNEYTEQLLKWWRANNYLFPSWALAARIVFSMPPSSAASERVFSLVKSMFGEEQLSSLSDFIQGSLMLRYNKRNVG